MQFSNLFENNTISFSCSTICKRVSTWIWLKLAEEKFKQTISTDWTVWHVLTICKHICFSYAGRGSPGLALRSLIFVIKDKTWRKREASQKEPKTIERLKERSGQRWRWQKRLGDLDTGSTLWSESMPQKECQQESIPAGQGPDNRETG